MRRRRIRTTVRLALRGSAAVLLVTGLLTMAGRGSAALDAIPGVPVTVVADADTYTSATDPEGAGTGDALSVGGPDNAVAYLKFSVPEMAAGAGLLRVLLLITPVRTADVLPAGVIDVHTVADTSWTEASLTGADAPALGPVVAVSMLNTAAITLAFNLSAAVTRSGVVSFGLTMPAGTTARGLVSREGGGAAWGPRLLVTPGPGGLPTPPTPPVPPIPPVGNCTVGAKLVPTCGVLLGVAPGALTTENRDTALTSFESEVGDGQAIYHGYHRGVTGMFPTPTEIAIARQPGNHHILFLNWRPNVASWASIASGNHTVDAYLDKLAGHLKANFTEPFFFTVHHEPENDVIEKAGSGYTATDYAAMYRHVVERLRGDGVTNLVTVMDYMAYAPWNTKSWWPDLYPGDDVVDWIAWDAYGYSTPHAYGYGDFAETVNRTSGGWPGIYTWASEHHPDKPLMVGEWGIWYSPTDPLHQAAVFASAGTEISSFPQIKALVYFDTPHDQRGRDSEVATTPQGVSAYRAFAALPMFRVAVP